MRKKVIFEDWLEKANLIWNGKYNYNEVKENWIDSRSKVPITCNQCGHRWLIKPSDHVAKSRLCGCPKCKYDDKRLDLNNLIKRFKKIHNNKYDYSEIKIYQNNHTKLPIICKEHGMFYQTVSSHLRGSGCPKCAYLNSSKKQTLSLNEFLKRKEEKFGNRYEVLEYKGMSKIGIFLCNECNTIFKTKSSNFLMYDGCCPKCKYEKISISERISNEEFLKRVYKIHKKRYEYLSKYEHAQSIIKIKCKKCCYIFEQKACYHLNGRGCPKCNNSKGENKIMDYLDENEITYETQFRFNDCKLEKPLPFDFYLPEYNICIEYDGEQHFKPVQFGGITEQRANELFKETIFRDGIKTEYCKQKGIKLIRISYKDDIEKILEVL